MKKTWIKSISLSLACLLGFGVLAATLAVNSKQSNPVKVDAVTTTTATLTRQDLLDHTTTIQKNTWGDWEWRRIQKQTLDIWNEAYLVNTKAYAYGATKIDFSISFKDGYVIPRINLNVAKVAENSNTFSYTIPENTYNENPPKRIYFNDVDGGEHLIETMTLTYTFTKYTVSLNSNGGTGGLSSVQVPYNRAMPTISSSNLPTREGYIFQGYYDTSASTGGNKYYNANGTSAKTFTNKDDSLKLYARWALAQKPVNITKGTGLSNVYVSSNGNVTSASSSDLKASGTNFAQGSTVYGYVKLAAGYQAQSGWTLKAGTADTEGALYLVGSGTVSSSGYDFGTFNASVIIYSIDYELNGGSVATANPTSYTIESDTFTLNNPTKEGYNFLGWSEEGKSGYTQTVTITKGTYGNKKYTANWELVEELQAVVDAINNLGGPTNISYPGSKTGLENAESLYSALNPTLKSILDADYADLVDELLDDRDAYDSLRNEAINDAIGKIDAIDETVSYPESRDVIFAARDAINALADEDKINVTNLDNYNDALDTYNALRDAAVEAVIEAIDNIDRDSEEHVVYPSSQASIENARTLYEALAPEEKEPSTAVTNYGELTQAESDYASLRSDAIGEVIAAINAISKPFDENRESQISNAQSLYDALAESDKDPTYVTNYSRLEDAHAADDVADAIEALPTVADTDDYRALVSGVREQYEALSDEQEAFLPRTSDIYGLLVEKEEAIKVINAINAIGDISYPGSEALITAANLAYENYINSGYNPDYIVNYDVLVKDNDDFYNVDNVAKLIEAIPTPAENQSYYDAVDIARTGYAALEDDEKQLLIEAIFDPVTNMTYAEYLFNQGLARDVIEKIDNIDDITYNAGVDDSLADIVAAETAYEAIKDNAYVKGIIDSVDYQTLVDDRTIYDHVDEVADLISDFTPAEDQSYYDAVDLASAKYNALTDKEQAIIDAATNIDYEEVLADHIAAKEVIELIGKIGTLTYDGGVNDSLSVIVAAEAAYDAIKDDADVKAIVDSVNHQTLVEDRTIYDNADAVAILIRAIPAPAEDQSYYDAVDAARSAYAALTEAEKQLLKDAIYDPATNMSYADYLYNQGLARDVIETIQNIGELTYDGGNNDSLGKIEAAEAAYEAIKDKEYVKAIVDSVNHQTLVEDRTIYDHADDVAKLIEAIPTPAEDQSYYDAVDAARSAYAALTEAEKQLLKDAIYDPATNMSYADYLYNQGLARDVIETIQNIGELTYDGGNNDSLGKIEAAEAAYEAIKDKEYVKAIVDSVNHQTLVSDRESYDEVDHTVLLIEEIGEIKNDEETKQDLEEAWEAYNALSPEEQALVQGYNNTYKTLDDDQHVYDALVLIDNIGTVSYDSVSEERIAEAREFYNSLTEDQKEQLGEEPLLTLVNSETTYAGLKKTANILVIILLIVVCLTILGGIWFLFFFLKKKRKDDDNKGKGKPVKAMSIGGFIPGITLISHYLDAPYIALYVLAGIGVLLWCAILVIVIMKKKQVGPFKKKAEVAKVEPQASVSQNEDEEVETITDEKGNVFQIRYIKSFTAKLIQSPEETKKYYEELKNEVLSYKKTNSRISWHYDAVNSGREYVLKFAIRGKTLCVYLPLDPEKQEEKYKVEKVESKRFEDVPCLYRIKNDRRCEYAKELIAKVCESMGLEKGIEKHEVYSNLPYEPNKPLIARGLIKEQMIAVNKPAESVVLESKVNADGDEVLLTKDANGNIFEIRYIKSFTAKLSQSEDVVKDYYTELKNYVLSYKDTHSRVSWHYDAVNIGRDYVLKFAIRGKTLCVFYALDPSKLDEKYKVEEAKGKKFEDVPCLYRIKNDRRLGYAKELIDMLMRKLEVEQGEIPSEDYHIKKESTKALLAKGLIKEVKSKVQDKKVIEHYESISVTKADEAMSDEKAEAAIEVDEASKKREGKKEVVNIDTLSQNYHDGDEITLDSLIEKKLVTSKAGYVKVLARGVLDKKLTVVLHDYSLQAVKMIVLMGGHAKKIK